MITTLKIIHIIPALLWDNLRKVLCLCLLGFIGVAQSQTEVLLTDYYSINDGLSDRLVTQIIQNKEGFLWLATPNGLNKFDGYEFTVYNDHPSNPRHINEVNINHIGEDKNGKIILTYRNNYVFFDLLNPLTDEIEKISLFPGNGISGIVRDIQLNRAGEVEILSNHNDTLKLFHLNEDHSFKLLFTVYRQHKTQTSPISFTKLINGNYLINDSENGLLLVDVEGNVLQEFQRRNFECLEEDFTFPTPTNILHQDLTGRIWVSYVNTPGVYLFNPNRSHFELLSGHETGFYTNLWEDQLGNVILPQTTGIGGFPKVLNLYCITTANEIKDFSYLLELSTFITNIYSKDFFKTLFLGIDTGLKIVQNNSHKIQTLLTSKLEKGQRGNVMRGITSDGKGKIYFAKEVNNWYALNTLTDQLDTLELFNSKTGERIDFNCCMDLLYEDDFLWGISCQQSTFGQLIKYNLNTNQADVFIYEQRLTSFIKSRDGKFWLTYRTSDKHGGLVAFDPNTEAWTNYTDADFNNPLREVSPSYMLEASNNALWIGTNEGLFKIDRDRRESTIWRMPEEKGQKGLLSNNIYVICEDAEQNLWIGGSNGLNKLNPENNEIISYDISNGLANNQVCGIIIDEKHNLWISTYNGLSYFDADSKLFKNFYKTDGLSDDEFNRFSFFKDQNGRYYFGGVNGINVFYPEDLLQNEDNPPLVLTKLSRYNSRKDTLIVQTSHLNNLNELVISPYDTYFQLNFSLPNYIQSKRNQFVSKLEGFENNWNYLGNTPQIRYNHLPAGSYTLKLRGADPNGNWHQTPLEVKIRVEPIFYQTWWAKVSFLLLSALILFGFFQYQLEQRLKVERLRTKISSDLHDEVSGLLSGIAMQADVLKAITQDETSKSKLQVISEVSRVAMTKMSDVIWSIDSRKDKVEDLIHRMREHAEDILEPLNIHYEFEIGKIDTQKKLPVNIRQNLYFIYKEAINNVAKHSKASHVVIQLGNRGQKFEFKIKDNGNGQGLMNSLKSKKTGQGISNLKMRAQRINALLHIANHDGFTVKLEMKKFA